MKTLLAFTLTFFLFNSFINKADAQTEENRTKVQLTINFEGKAIVTDLNSVGTSLTRSMDESLTLTTSKDSVKNKIPSSYPGSFYLTIDVKKISDDLFKVFSKKQNRFDGVITVVDTYGKNPTRTIKFKQASLYSYSDQLSAASYNDAYGSTAISFFCKEVFINGIPIEQ